MARQAGENILASDIVRPKWIQKAANESVTSSSSMQNDDDFTVSLAAGSWRVQLFAHATGATGADIKLQWDFTGAVSVTARSCIGPQVATTDVTVTTTRTSGHGFSSSIQYGLDGANVAVLQEDLVLTVTTAGVLTLQWAQQVGNATATVLTTASRMYIDQLEAA